MIVEAVNPKTGEKCSTNFESLKPSDLEELTKEYITEAQLKGHIDNLPLSAEVKAILFGLANFSIQVGQAVVRIGKKIIEIALMLAAKYRHATFALTVACLLSLLISMIPLIGPILASFFGPMIAVLGLGIGIWEDMKRDDPKFATVIVDAGAMFSPLASSRPA